MSIIGKILVTLFGCLILTTFLAVVFAASYSLGYTTSIIFHAHLFNDAPGYCFLGFICLAVLFVIPWVGYNIGEDIIRMMSR